MADTLASIAIGAIVGVSSWVAATFAARPFLDLREKRLAAITAAERYGFVDQSSSQELRQTAL